MLGLQGLQRLGVLIRVGLQLVGLTILRSCRCCSILRQPAVPTNLSVDAAMHNVCMCPYQQGVDNLRASLSFP